jgi:hypothetical protein
MGSRRHQADLGADALTMKVPRIVPAAMLPQVWDDDLKVITQGADLVSPASMVLPEAVKSSIGKAADPAVSLYMRRSPTVSNVILWLPTAAHRQS